MAKTQKVSYGNAIVLPVNAGDATTPVLKDDAGATIVKLVNELVPSRLHGRRAMWVKNNSAANTLNITAPSGSIYVLALGATVQWPSPELLEDGAYTITGTAGQTFSFWEAY